MYKKVIITFMVVLCILFTQAYGSSEKEIVPDDGPLSYSDLQYPYPTKQISINSHKLVYIDQGSGTPIIFIHGASTDLSNFDILYPEFIKEGYRVIGIDLLGYGKSDKPDADYTVQFHAKTILELIKELSLKNVILLGHNSGATIAMVTALEEPVKIQSLILIAPLGLINIPKSYLTYYARNFDNNMGKTYIDSKAFTKFFKTNVVYNRTSRTDAFLKTRLRLIQHPEFKTILKAIKATTTSALGSGEYLLENIKSIKQPALVFLGGKDSVAEIEYNITNRNNQWQVIRVQDSKILIHFEQTKVAVDESIKFLKSIK